MSPQDLSNALILAAGVAVVSVATIRDWVIIVAGSLFTLVLFLVFIFTFVLGLSVRALLKTIQRTLTEEVSPLLNSVRQSVNTVQGTTAFISESAVAPIVRVYGIIAGIRRGLGVLGGVRGRKDEQE